MQTMCHSDTCWLPPIPQTPGHTVPFTTTHSCITAHRVSEQRHRSLSPSQDLWLSCVTSLQGLAVAANQVTTLEFSSTFSDEIIFKYLEFMTHLSNVLLSTFPSHVFLPTLSNCLQINLSCSLMPTTPSVTHQKRHNSGSWRSRLGHKLQLSENTGLRRKSTLHYTEKTKRR